ncbi:hypothetical protein VOLCADRAFT_107815 [Volvox carteri f. nagariensis]|uniref:ABC1 atypical kinase-like domain-containing protein n=1 Tax=Volvox carteri f. nagariensis TaxID=3068 RepID=D8UGM4_VOLCA|nr:uncharacterized protein VOLCADRAFT_107815 [Volvox carteri f. nagariensis]EFJ41125.1 hypothetical protein VOLCADRAFT_107815 [Volvox carteri f. nagariensis]|eukprot:XP_002957797.1 hypothetical protein VOLCADRAFT_107815 [Volvox carteri f. nagariensis]
MASKEILKQLRRTVLDEVLTKFENLQDGIGKRRKAETWSAYFERLRIARDISWFREKGLKMSTVNIVARSTAPLDELIKAQGDVQDEARAAAAEATEAAGPAAPAAQEATNVASTSTTRIFEGTANPVTFVKGENNIASTSTIAASSRQVDPTTAHTAVILAAPHCWAIADSCWAISLKQAVRHGTFHTSGRRQPQPQQPLQKATPQQQLQPAPNRDDSDIDIPEFMEPSTYDAAMNSRYWETRPVRVLARLLRIGERTGGGRVGLGRVGGGGWGGKRLVVAAARRKWEACYTLCGGGKEGGREEGIGVGVVGWGRGWMLAGGSRLGWLGLGRLSGAGVEFGGWAAAARARNLRIKDPAQQEVAAAESLKDVLVRLGPAFVKIGQALSSRPDVLPPPYIAALEALQDRIPPFPDSAAMAVLESELGVPPSSVFCRLSPSPVAAASLGQVYRGALRPELGGGEVAVKVQRPRVAQMIAQDVYILRILAGWLRTARRFNTDLPALVDEWASSLFRELNYRTEAANARRFKELFSHLPQVYVPHIYDEYTTAKVLTMEWIEAALSATTATITTITTGARASQQLEDLALVEVGVRCSLEQMLEEGFYHADPHPGNLLRTPDGRLAYLDFGMMGQIDERTRNALMTATLHLVNREYGRLAEDFIILGLLPAGTDRDAVLPALTGVFSEALKGGVSNLSFGQLSGNLGVTMYKYSFRRGKGRGRGRIPPYYTLLVRSLSVLEGIALAADPNYKVLGSAYPWIARRLLTDPSGDLRKALRRLLYTEEGQFRFDRLESLLRQAAKSANRLKRPQQQQRQQLQGARPAALTSVDGGGNATTTTTTTTGATSSSRNAARGNGDGGGALLLLLSRDGEFVRGILLDEVAKGIDGAWRIAADATVATVRQGVAGLPTPALPLLALLPGGGAATARQCTGGRVGWVAPSRDLEEKKGVDVGVGLKLPTVQQPDTATSSSSLSSASSSSSAAAAGPRPPASPADLYDAVTQASEAVLWLAREAADLPLEARGELLQLPLQLGSRVASRVTARALRALVLGSGGEGDGSGENENGGSGTAPGELAAAVCLILRFRFLNKACFGAAMLIIGHSQVIGEDMYVCVCRQARQAQPHSLNLKGVTLRFMPAGDATTASDPLRVAKINKRKLRKQSSTSLCKHFSSVPVDNDLQDQMLSTDNVAASLDATGHDNVERQPPKPKRLAPYQRVWWRLCVSQCQTASAPWSVPWKDHIRRWQRFVTTSYRYEIHQFITAFGDTTSGITLQALHAHHSTTTPRSMAICKIIKQVTASSLAGILSKESLQVAAFEAALDSLTIEQEVTLEEVRKLWDTGVVESGPGVSTTDSDSAQPALQPTGKTPCMELSDLLQGDLRLYSQGVQGRLKSGDLEALLRQDAGQGRRSHLLDNLANGHGPWIGRWANASGCSNLKYQLLLYTSDYDGGAVLEWLVARGVPMGDDGKLYVTAAHCHDLVILRCLRRLGCPWGPGVFSRAVYDKGALYGRSNGSTPEVLQWLHAEGCPLLPNDSCTGLSHSPELTVPGLVSLPADFDTCMTSGGVYERTTSTWRLEFLVA